jgi:uncharacterized membrane protein
MNNFELD